MTTTVIFRTASKYGYKYMGFRHLTNGAYLEVRSWLKSGNCIVVKGKMVSDWNRDNENLFKSLIYNTGIIEEKQE